MKGMCGVSGEGRDNWQVAAVERGHRPSRSWLWRGQGLSECLWSTCHGPCLLTWPSAGHRLVLESGACQPSFVGHSGASSPHELTHALNYWWQIPRASIFLFRDNVFQGLYAFSQSSSKAPCRLCYGPVRGARLLIPASQWLLSLCVASVHLGVCEMIGHICINWWGLYILTSGHILQTRRLSFSLYFSY